MTKEMETEKKSGVSDVGAWAMNVVSSVGLIMANKQLMSSGGYAFNFATTLTGFHFAVTALSGLFFNPTTKHVPMWELLWFSIVANTSITGMNLSLMLNSVGFYQISKLSMIPVVCLMERAINNKQYSTKVKISVIVVVIGVGVCTVTDVKVNAKGFLCALVAVVSTSLQQIYIGSFQKKYSIGSFELLSKTAPIQAVSLLVFGPFIDYYLNGQVILNYGLSWGAFICISISCTLAVFCNMSQYLCIGRFSAVSFQVLGHMKTVCVLTLGWVLFDSALSFKNILGMAVAIAGMIIYNWAMDAEKQGNAKMSIKESLTEEEIKLLKEGVENAPVKDIELGESKKTQIMDGASHNGFSTRAVAGAVSFSSLGFFFCAEGPHSRAVSGRWSVNPVHFLFSFLSYIGYLPFHLFSLKVVLLNFICIGLIIYQNDQVHLTIFTVLLELFEHSHRSIYYVEAFIEYTR